MSADYSVAVDGYSTGILAIDQGIGFSTEITFGSEVFNVLVDTGSSDTWLVRWNFSCVDHHEPQNPPLTQAECHFGPAYNITDTFRPIDNETFSIQYGDGTFVRGSLGYEQITLAGIQVETIVGIVDVAGWSGNGVDSGVLGLAYPQGEVPSS